MKNVFGVIISLAILLLGFCLLLILPEKESIILFLIGIIIGVASVFVSMMSLRGTTTNPKVPIVIVTIVDVVIAICFLANLPVLLQVLDPVTGFACGFILCAGAMAYLCYDFFKNNKDYNWK